MGKRSYIAIDLKSFYASVECAERGLDPLTANLVVADVSRTGKTICLAVSPSLKALGVSGRARLFEVIERTREVNAERAQELRRLRSAYGRSPSSGSDRSLFHSTDRSAKPSSKAAPSPAKVPSKAAPNPAATSTDPASRGSWAPNAPGGSKPNGPKPHGAPLETSDSPVAGGIPPARLMASDTFGSQLPEVAADTFTDAFAGTSIYADELARHPELQVDYLIAKPRMARYVEHSTAIYEVYLKYIAPEDIHVYSIDEVFIDATNYLRTYKMDARALAATMIRDVLQTTGITAAAGIGDNLYLAKVAMDIVAKHVAPDEDGVRIAELDEQSYRRLLWDHRPLTDFWRVGAGTAQRLEKHGMFTMGDVARCSLGAPGAPKNEDLLFRLLGVNAELLIDHAWGLEPVTIADIKAYRPSVNSICAGQVLQCPYRFAEARLVAWEMADQLALDLTARGQRTDKLVLTVGYDVDNLKDPAIADNYDGEVTEDRYGRRVPKHAHGTKHLEKPTASSHGITAAVLELFDNLVNEHLRVRRITITADNLQDDAAAQAQLAARPRNLFADEEAEAAQAAEEAREKQMQDAILDIREKFGKNAILRAASLQEGATARQRNGQIGGHSA